MNWWRKFRYYSQCSSKIKFNNTIVEMIIHSKKIIISILIVLWLYTIPLNSLAGDRSFWSMIGVDGIHTIWTQEKQEDSLLHTIQSWINRVLGILAFITLCFVLYAGFLMLTSWGDSKKYNSWLDIIKNAALWLAIIGVSRLIVSLIFYVISSTTKPNLI